MSRSDGSSNGPLIALTGGTGFLGSHIADALLAAGYAVRISVRPTSRLRWLDGKDVQTVAVDLNDGQQCRDFLSGTSGLVHCAGVVAAPDEAILQRANVETTKNLLAAARETWSAPRDADLSPAFILISSLAAYGPASLENPATEDGPCCPITAYGRSKQAAEKACLETRWPFRTAVLRPPSLYGPRDREFLPLLRVAGWGWTARIGRHLQGLSLVDGRDAAAAAVALLGTQSAQGPFFIDDGTGGYDWPALANALSRAVGKPVRTFHLPLSLLEVTARLVGARIAKTSPILNPDRLRDLQVPGWVCDGRRLTAVTGFKARWTAGDGFKDTLDFYREQKWL